MARKKASSTRGSDEDDTQLVADLDIPEGPIVEIRVKVRVTNEEDLREYAIENYQMAWQDETWEPKDIAEAVLEALVLSNENPSPAEYGIEIEDYDAYILAPGE